jgi:hypothetical protein
MNGAERAGRKEEGREEGCCKSEFRVVYSSDEK